MALNKHSLEATLAHRSTMAGAKAAFVTHEADDMPDNCV
jgi:hypothetical protein